MSPSNLQKLLVILVAIASLGATTLVLMNVLVRQQSRSGSSGGYSGGSGGSGGGVFEQPIALPAFNFTDRSGDPVTLESLRGKVWVANFVFTRCAGPCPRLTAEMAQLQEQLRQHPRWEDIRLVTVTVDPDFDTPEVLAQYARGFGADPQQWLFLTGERPEVWGFIRAGFKLPVEPDPESTVMPILHSQKFVLVDKQGRVRGYYDGVASDSDHERRERRRLLVDLERLLRE